jgi:hypothetical protein
MVVRAMNVCLVAKWIDGLERGDNSICCELLRRKYLGQKSIFQIKRINGSQFWRGILEVRQWYQIGRAMKVSIGVQTRFWEGTWLGNYTLKVEFYQLFQICDDPNVSINKRYG